MFDCYAPLPWETVAAPPQTAGEYTPVPARTLAAGHDSTAGREAARPAAGVSFTSPETVPSYSLAYGRRVVRGLRFPNGGVLVRELFRVCAQVRGRHLDPVERERVVLLARALWREGVPSPLGGRAF